MKRNVIMFLSVFLVAASCATQKSKSREVYEEKYYIYRGNYNINSVTKTDSEIPQLHCSVFCLDDLEEPYNNWKPCYATVTLTHYGSNGMLTSVPNIDGYVEFKVLPVGKYKIEVEYVGFETIEISNIDFKPYTRTEIRFELGQVQSIIYTEKEQKK